MTDTTRRCILYILKNKLVKGVLYEWIEKSIADAVSAAGGNNICGGQSPDLGGHEDRTAGENLSGGLNPSRAGGLVSAGFRV